MIYEFAATQDLHGYEKPWAPGAGVNQWDGFNGYWSIANGNKTESGSSLNYQSSEKIKVTEGEQFYLTKDIASSASYVCYWLSEEFVSGAQANLSELQPLTIPSGVDEFAIDINFYSQANALAAKVMLAKGSSAVLTWTPYANICPPEGFNIWDPETQDFKQVYAGYVDTFTRELYLRPVYPEYAGEELVGPWMSDIDEYSEDATPTEGAFVIDFGGELTSYEITAFMLQTLLDSLGIRQHFTNGAGLLNSLMDQAQGRVRSEEELLHLSRPLNVIAIGDQLPAGITFKPISKDVLPGLPGKFIR